MSGEGDTAKLVFGTCCSSTPQTGASLGKTPSSLAAVVEQIVAILLHLTFLGDGFLHLTLTLPSLLPDPKSGIVSCKTH